MSEQRLNCFGSVNVLLPQLEPAVHITLVVAEPLMAFLHSPRSVSAD